MTCTVDEILQGWLGDELTNPEFRPTLNISVSRINHPYLPIARYFLTLIVCFSTIGLCVAIDSVTPLPITLSVL